MKKQLMRSGRDKKIAGVCAGVAHYFDMDPTIVRVIWGVLAFGYGAGIIAYIILWIIAPVATDY
ncbi:stress-responsive transcriptional regulator [Streptococcus pneumoniae]|nr:stress-responsive transcriptional regulator [Streptococcus pneumoniae]